MTELYCNCPPPQNTLYASSFLCSLVYILAEWRYYINGRGNCILLVNIWVHVSSVSSEQWVLIGIYIYYRRMGGNGGCLVVIISYTSLHSTVIQNVDSKNNVIDNYNAPKTSVYRKARSKLETTQQTRSFTIYLIQSINQYFYVYTVPTVYQKCDSIWPLISLSPVRLASFVFLTGRYFLWWIR